MLNGLNFKMCIIYFELGISFTLFKAPKFQSVYNEESSSDALPQGGSAPFQGQTTLLISYVSLFINANI